LGCESQEKVVFRPKILLRKEKEKELTMPLKRARAAASNFRRGVKEGSSGYNMKASSSRAKTAGRAVGGAKRTAKQKAAAVKNLAKARMARKK
jgi:hypothetical protein